MVLYSQSNVPTVFTCFGEQDLKIQPVFKRFIIDKDMDDDVDTDEEQHHQGSKLCFHQLKTAIVDVRQRDKCKKMRRRMRVPKKQNSNKHGGERRI